MAGLLDFSSPLAKVELITFAIAAASLFFNFFALVTPSWHVATDTDAHRDVQSGLWQYCQGGLSCWYIFSDDVVNYYERADICRFLLIGDCRKKLLRTPYFFGWHYAVLIMMIIAVVLSAFGLAFGALAKFRPGWSKWANIVVLSVLGTALLVESIGLAVFMINGEMLESRYLIGIKNTFEKHYGFSFYLAFLGCALLLFAVFASLFSAVYPLLFKTADANNSSSLANKYAYDLQGRPISRAVFNDYDAARHAALTTAFPTAAPSRQSQYAASEASGHTRTFISY